MPKKKSLKPNKPNLNYPLKSASTDFFFPYLKYVWATIEFIDNSTKKKDKTHLQPLEISRLFVYLLYSFTSSG